MVISDEHDKDKYIYKLNGQLIYEDLHNIYPEKDVLIDMWKAYIYINYKYQVIMANSYTN